MISRFASVAAAVGVLILPSLLAVAPRAASSDAPGWDAKAAAAYLDGRSAWWSTWPTAARDHDTFCVSCHTAVPYALARPALRSVLNEREPAAPEKKLFDNVTARVTRWQEMAPFYPDQTRGLPKSSESRGTESILNAVILANRDANRGQLSDETRTALQNMWALQMRTGDLSGAWAWLDFHYEPWESKAAPYFGASLAAVAVGIAPGYATSADIQDNLKLLRGYFQREYANQSLYNKLMSLWAAAKVSGILDADERQAIVDAALRAQQDDGGWSMASLGAWKRIDGTEIDTHSDGYATGLTTLILQEAGVSPRSDRLVKGLAWLTKNQVRGSGQWLASSLNKARDPASDAGRFMSDAATGFAVLSLARAR